VFCILSKLFVNSCILSEQRSPSTKMTIETATEAATTSSDQPKRKCRCVHLLFSCLYFISHYSGKVDISLGIVTQHNIMQLKKVNSVVFPVSYNDKFYKDVVNVGDLAKLGLFVF
jgi:hypothetical protein